MENATKALIIAAAVLVALLVIALGVGVYNAASEQTGDINMTEYEIQKFNEKFTQYQGNNVSGIKVNAMLKAVFYHNQANPDDSNMRVRVGLNGGGNGNGSDKSDTEKWLIMREQFFERETLPTVPSVNSYNVEIKFNSKTRLVEEIQVRNR